jgi:hypothetical protein
LHISSFITALDVYVGCLALFWTREEVRESLGLEMPYLFLYAFILFVVARNVLFWHIYFYSPSKYACVISALY